MCKFTERGYLTHHKELPSTSLVLPGNSSETGVNSIEDLIMLWLAVSLFVVGTVIAILNAYYCGKCFAVGQPKEYAHFTPCTFF